jgi:septum formation protein
MESIILASGSLRRQEYFKLLGLPFSIMPSLVDENPGKITNPGELAGDLAVKKVKKVIETLKDRLPSWICGADTIISFGGEIYGKPKDREDAGNMIRRLSGQEHEVVTGLALYNGKTGTMDCRTVSSSVVFASITEGEIEWYLNTGEWQGVAGAYRIQGLASCFVSSIKGSFSAIVGLPIHEFYVMLRDNGYPYGGYS